MNTIKEYIGAITLSDKVDITDPCYDKDVWCRMTSKCMPGEYTGYAFTSDQGEWGNRVSAIAIYKDDEHYDLDDMEYLGDIGVDAGLAGFFNNKPDFLGNKWDEFLHESGVFNDSGYDYDKEFYSVDYGVFSSSGFGDGSYEVYATPERNAFMIIFIDDYEDEDDCDDYDEDYEDED